MHLLLLKFLILTSEVLNRTPCHMCHWLYLPMSLSRAGLFNLINVDSLIVPTKFWPLLPRVLRLSSVACGGLVTIYR